MSSPDEAYDVKDLVALSSVGITIYVVLAITALYQYRKLPHSYNDHPIRKHRRAFYIAAILLCISRVIWCSLSMAADASSSLSTGPIGLT